MNQIIELNNYKRKELFNHYHQNTNPFIYLTIKLDITNIAEYCHKHKNHYATIGYIIVKTANEIDNFKYRYENNKIIHYDKLNINFTQKINDDIGYFSVKYNDNYKNFIKDFVENQKDFYLGKAPKNYSQDEIWVSCTPWYDFTSLVPPFNKEVTIPQFIWGKFFKEDNKTYTHLMIMVHHGFADGSHIGLFIEKLKENIKNFNNIVKENEK